MEYGNTFEKVIQNLSRPVATSTPYGRVESLVKEPEFRLTKYVLTPSKTLFNLESGIYFLEIGELEISGQKVLGGSVIQAPRSLTSVTALTDCCIYYFNSPGLSISEKLKINPTTDVREKYWGKIETICSSESMAGKRIFMREDTQSSLEYHLKKKEVYYLQNGRLRIGLRVGRAENKSIILNPGDVFIIHPGVMHMRIAEKESIIFEISTKDEDSDSHLVEDGQTYKHIEKSS